MLRILEKISEGRSEDGDIAKLRQLSLAMQKASLCGLGQTAANPVLSTLRYFKEEYDRHVHDKTCPAGKCRGLYHYVIVSERCKRCGLCLRHCPAGAITGSRDEPYLIHQEKCIRCGQCYEVCKFKAIDR